VEVAHQDAGKVMMAGLLARFGDTPLPQPVASPALGEHAAEILLKLGFAEDEIRRWREAGKVGWILAAFGPGTSHKGGPRTALM
jgi:crotonobetainyl-CoA:carnitine CoA-transferase CaiB-like acyl-CoA transferase